MKLTTIMILAAALQVSAKSDAQGTVTYSAKSVSIEKVFSAIKKQTGYTFFYREEDIAGLPAVSVAFKQTPLETALQQALKGQPLKYSIQGKTIFITRTSNTSTTNSTVMLSGDEALPPPIDIKGRIVNEKGEPVVATVLVKGTGKGTTTNDNGEFELKGVDDNATLVISGVSIESFEVKVNGRSELVLEAKVRTVQGEEVTITGSTGYQTVPKVTATGSFDVINTGLLNRRISTNVLDRIENLSPGVFFDKSSNAIDALLVRGRSTINSDAKPLIILNNFPYDGNINNINPNDIDNITILKDAAAASIWGARSGNGVIVITTKKGKTQKAHIEFNTNLTSYDAPDIKNLSAISSADYIEFEKKLYSLGFYNSALNNPRLIVSPVASILRARDNGTIPASDANSQIETLKSNNILNDIQDKLYQSQLNQQYSLNVSGNNDAVSYYFSGGYDKNKLNLKGSGANRITLRSQNVFKLTQKLTLDATINYVTANNDTKNNPGINVSNGSGKSIYPYARLVDGNNNPAVLLRDFKTTFKNQAQTAGLLNWDYSPLEDIEHGGSHFKTNDILLNLGGSYKMGNTISFDLKYQFEYNNIRNSIDYDENSYYARNLINLYSQVSNGQVKRPIPVGGIQTKFNSELGAHQGRFQINYNSEFGQNHEISAIAGAEIKQQILKGDNYIIYGYNSVGSAINSSIDFASEFPRYDLPFIRQRIPNPQSISTLTDRYVSYYGNAVYNFKRKYSFSISGRQDASNLFGVKSNQKTIPLWSVGASWQVDKEKFFKVSWIPYLKLRTTYGYQGNVNKSTSAYTTALYDLSWTTGAKYAMVQTPPNEHLRWEKVGIYNIGVDFSIVNEILSGSIEYYKKKATDLIATSPLDPTTGISSFVGNTASMKGRGVDVELQSVIVNRKLKWIAKAIFSKTTNELTKYAPAVSTLGTTYVEGTLNPIIGNSLFGMYAYKWAGLDAVKGNPQGILQGVPSTDYSGILANTTIDSLVFIGPVQPTRVGSLINTFEIKNFSVSFIFSYRGGYYFRKPSINYSTLANSWNGHSDYEKRWQKPGDELQTNVPSFTYPLNTDRDFFYKYSETLIRKADHIRWDDLSISYTLRKGNTKSLPFEQVRLFIYLNNLGVIWNANKENLDPNYINVIRPKKSFATGINISF